MDTKQQVGVLVGMKRTICVYQNIPVMGSIQTSGCAAGGVRVAHARGQMTSRTSTQLWPQVNS